ncbi:MAG TPA: DUF1848 domain-containing protein [Aggregatilineales bacterium]|nr:DUF1848 domain-containing protein [Aggregatilineales bacterium]
MPRIISCSRRTDIPAFYSRWLINRLRAGYCHVINPYNNRVVEVSLRPEDCLTLVFWTRHPAPLVPHLDELDARGYRYYFHYTLLGYEPPIHSHNPALEAGITTFQRLSDRLSPDRVRWRYDPIVLSSATPRDYHLRQFERITSRLDGYTRHCTFSFTSFYGKTTRNLAHITRTAGITFSAPDLAQQPALVGELAAIAAAHGMTLNTCCDDLLAIDGVQKNRCVDPALVQALVPDQSLDLKPQPTRKDCGCVASVDIGAYDTCLFGCAYCYATNSRMIALKNHTAHDPEDSVLWRPKPLIGADLREIVATVSVPQK